MTLVKINFSNKKSTQVKVLKLLTLMGEIPVKVLLHTQSKK